MADPLLVFDRAIEVQERLLAAGIDNAIGGALALGYHVDDPRGTQDTTLERIRRDDQVRIMWPVEDDLPIPCPVQPQQGLA